MISIRKIIDFLENSYTLSYTDAALPEVYISGAKLIGEVSSGLSNTLIISTEEHIDSDSFSLSSAMDNILLSAQPSDPYNSDTHTEDAGVILIYGVESVSDLAVSINNFINFETRIQAQSNELYHMLYHEPGIEHIIIKAEKYLRLPIAVLDSSYQMIAVSPLMKQVPFGMVSSSDGIYLGIEEIESLRRLHIENQLYKETGPFFINPEDHPETIWIFCPIRIQKVMTGYIAVCMGADQTPTDYELRITKTVADICAIEMQKHSFFVHQTGMQYETFLTELIEGRFSDVSMISSRLRTLNRHLGKFFCIAVFYCSSPHNSDLFNQRQMSRLRNIYANSMSIVYQGNIVLLVNQDQPVMINSALTDPMEEFAERNDLKVGLSQPFADVLKLSIFYKQALNCLHFTDPANPDKRIYYATELLPEYLFSNCDYMGLESGIHYNIFQLMDYDGEFNTEFIPTLRAYLKNDRNATKTAEALHLHRSTLFYRIKKIEEILDISITDSSLMFLYELSFKIWDYLSK